MNAPNSKQVLLTSDGLKKLEAELLSLKTEGRKDVADKIKQALSFGDLSENSEYEEAKNQQAMLEARIIQVESMLKNVKIIEESEINTEKINVGNKVKIRDTKAKAEFLYHIVGSTEANPFEMKLSDESPLGKALLDKKAGQKVTIHTPKGNFTYEVLEISK